MVERLGYRGYVTSRDFGGYRIPVPVQSLVLRDYCRRHGFLYVLPVNENIFPNSYMVLDGLIHDLSPYEGIVMCSMHMLPRRKDRRIAVLEAVLSQEASLHLIFEELVVQNAGDIKTLEELLTFYQLSRTALPIVQFPVELPSAEED